MEEPITTSHDDVGGAVTETTAPSVYVLSGAVHVDDLTIERKVIAEYLQGIAPEKQAIALVHALEVGVTEMLARRERFRH
jgi:hypothetical protein